MGPTFYFTCHPGDLSRKRLPEQCHVMLVAAAHWDDTRKRFRISRPPADHVAGMCVDSGGFTAAARWGRYPWQPEQYAAFVRAVSRDVPLAFCAVMDYACEPNVNRSILATNRERIDATIANEIACRDADPGLPWLPVLQGDNLVERAYDLDARRAAALLPASYAGIGSVCGRGAVAARKVIRFYAGQLFGVRYHAFGMHIGAMDDRVVPGALRSWDSYSWTWARGARSMRAPEYLKREDENYASYARRLAEVGYWLSVKDGDPRAFDLFRRHYTYQAYADGRRDRYGYRNRFLICGPGEKLLLLGADERALFVWRRFTDDAGQDGVNCAVFRNESNERSSELIREAAALAWGRWPGQRLYTYVNPRTIRSTNPGYCFLRAGWRKVGVTKWNKLIILDLLPT